MRYIFLLLFPLFLNSCDSSRVYEEFRDLEGDWLLEEPLVFTIPVDSANEVYALKIHVRNDSDYPYYNLYYKVKIRNAEGQLVTDQLKEIILFDPKTGEPLGSGLGNSFQNTGVIFEDYSFPDKGIYQVELYQYMRTDTLTNIDRVGLKASLQE